VKGILLLLVVVGVMVVVNLITAKPAPAAKT